MKMLFKLIIVLIFVAGCTKHKEPSDPIIGSWKLTSMYRNDTLLTLDQCRFNSTIEASNDNTLKLKDFHLNTTNNCIENIEVAKWFAKRNNFYYIDNGSRIDQKTKIAVNNNTLTYSFEGWEFISTPNTTIIKVAAIKLGYTKY